jgi:hypothetical protein
MLADVAHGSKADLKTADIPKWSQSPKPGSQGRSNEPHSALMPAALMIGHHFSISALC